MMSTASIILLNTGLVFLLAGLFMRIKPPKEINAFYGYRTRRSMKNQQAWDYAQPYSGKMLQRLGGLHLTMALVGCALPDNRSWMPLVILGFVVISVVLTILKIEQHLKITFPDQAKSK